MTFQIRGSDGDTVLYHEDTSNGCVLWAEMYTRRGDWGGWDHLELWEMDEDSEIIVSYYFPADEDNLKPRWKDCK